MHQDISHTAIRVGDHIVYGVTCGRSVVLKFGRVVALTSKKDWADKVEHKVQAVTVENDWGDGWKLQKKGQRITLQLRTVLAVPARIVPSEARTILAAAAKAQHKIEVAGAWANDQPLDESV